MNQSKTKKILIPIFNRAHYGRLRSVFKAIREHPSLEFQIIVSSVVAYDNFLMNLRHSHPYSWRLALPWYIRARLLAFLSKFGFWKITERDFLIKNLIKDGFPINTRVPLFFDGGLSTTMAKTVGFGIVRIVDELERLGPDIVFIDGDRFEMMAVALAAVYLNIPIAHHEGGDVSGTIDESIRHSITKLAHLHFVTTEMSRKRVIQMGENPSNVFVVGSPAIDVIKNLDLDMPQNIFPDLDLNKPYLLVLFHPVTTESPESNILMTQNITKVIEELAMPTVFLGSNIDAGSREVGLATKRFLAKKLPFVYSAKLLYPDVFYRVLAKASCALGNSSSFIKEGAYFGTPAVIVGSRQQNRERGKNIKEVGLNTEEIKQAVREQIQHGRYAKDLIFGDGNAGQRMADILAKIEPNIQKKFFDLE